MNDAPFTSFGEHPFVSLATFRKTGVAVATPVWIARDGETLLVITPEESGKVKRLRNNPRVELQPCSRMGRVSPHAPIIEGVAEIVRDDDGGRLERVFSNKYGPEYHATMAVERLIARRHKPRVFLRISPAPVAQNQGASS